MATPSRFELPISSLTGRRVRPLHHGATFRTMPLKALRHLFRLTQQRCRINDKERRKIVARHIWLHSCQCDRFMLLSRSQDDLLTIRKGLASQSIFVMVFGFVIDRHRIV